MSIVDMLRKRYDMEEREGWQAFSADPVHLELRGFRTKRIGKLMPNGQFQFTIGARGVGKDANLNDTIRMIIASEGLEVIEATSTNSGKASYPAFLVGGINADTAERLFSRVEGAVIHVQRTFDT